MCTNNSDPPVDWIMDVNSHSMLNLPRLFMVPIYHIQVSIRVNVLMRATMDASGRAIAGNVLNPVISARIFSNFSFLYGRVEVRAKLPVGNWLWPAIWMLPEAVCMVRGL